MVENSIKKHVKNDESGLNFEKNEVRNLFSRISLKLNLIWKSTVMITNKTCIGVRRRRLTDDRPSVKELGELENYISGLVLHNRQTLVLLQNFCFLSLKVQELRPVEILHSGKRGCKNQISNFLSHSSPTIALWQNISLLSQRV